MVPARFDILMPVPGEIRLHLAGHFDPTVTENLERAVQNALRGFPSKSFYVVVDMRELMGCSVFARVVLVRIQKIFASESRRTIYIASRSRVRGLVLWIIHLANDSNARVVTDEEQINESIAQGVDHVSGVSSWTDRIERTSVPKSSRRSRT